jgi:hypothetical protein
MRSCAKCLLSFAPIVLTCVPIVAFCSESTSAPESMPTVLFATMWETPEHEYHCAVTLRGSGADAKDELTCYQQSGIRALSVLLDPGIVGIHVVGLVGGPLVVSWQTGSGYLFRAYADNHDGTIAPIWEAGSFMPAEWFSLDAVASTNAVALAQPGWRKGADGIRQKYPKVARVFAIESARFRLLGECAWSQRFIWASSHVRPGSH